MSGKRAVSVSNHPRLLHRRYTGFYRFYRLPRDEHCDGDEVGVERYEKEGVPILTKLV